MKLFVSDIDGTLYWYDHKNNKGVSDSCRNYIHKWIELGNIFALATARTYLKRDDAIQDLKINVDYLGGNGAEIVYHDNTTEFITLPFAYFLEVCKWVSDHNYNATVKICVDDHFVAKDHDHYPFDHTERMRNNLINSSIYDPNRSYSDNGVNMSLLCEPSLTKMIESSLQKLFEGRCKVLANDIDNIDFIPLNISKSKAVEILAKHYNIDMKDVIVIGDEANDVDMFKITKNSYCMAHSDKSIQKQANSVVELVEDAIRIEIEKIV